MIKIEEPRKKLSEKRLDQVEKNLGILFPVEYRQFLIKYNGGRPSPNRFEFLRKKGPYTDSRVDWFLAVYLPGMNDYDDRDDNLAEIFDVYKGDEDRIPKELVPIAFDPFGNLICIAVSGKNVGKVYFWDHEGEGLSDKPSYRNVYLVANSFNAFLNKLHDY